MLTYTCMSNPACWRSLTSGRLPAVMEYGLHSPITSFVASSSFLKASESRLQAIPWSACTCCRQDPHLTYTTYSVHLCSHAGFPTAIWKKEESIYTSDIGKNGGYTEIKINGLIEHEFRTARRAKNVPHKSNTGDCTSIVRWTPSHLEWFSLKG